MAVMVGKTDAEIAALAPVQSVAGEVGAISASTLKSAISLNSVTNDAQTKAAIVPNAPPAAGQLLVGNASGAAYGVVSASGDATINSAGVITVSKVNGSTLGTMADQNANAVTINGGTISGTTISVPTPVNSTDPVNKAYADALAAGRGLFQLDIDCSTNPNYPSAEKGWQYCVTVAGKIGGASGPDVEIGDTIQAKANVSAGSHAAVGSSWFILQGNLVGAIRASNNLSDVASTSAALSNLGGQPASSELSAYAALSTTGVVCRTAANTIVPRTLTGTTHITVTNGNGVSGNPTFSVGSLVMLSNAFCRRTQQQPFGAVTLTDGASISWNCSSQESAFVTLAGNRTLADPVNMVDGGTYQLRVKQDATGGRTLAYGSAYDWGVDGPPTLSTGANKIDILTFTSDGTKMYGAYKKGFG